MIRISLGVGLALVIVAAAVPASAQVRRHDGYPYATNGSNGFDYGYREGLQHGERDARQNRPFDFNDSNDYRRAERGYDRRTGDINSYRREFRRGYEAGYRNGYSRSGNWDRNRYPDGRYDRNGGYYPNSRYGYPGGGYGNRGYAGPASQYRLQRGLRKGPRGSARPRCVRAGAAQVVPRRRSPLQQPLRLA